MYRSCFIYLAVLAVICSADLFDDVDGVNQFSGAKSRQTALFPNIDIHDKFRRVRSIYPAARQMTESSAPRPTPDPCFDVFSCVRPHFDEVEGDIYSGIRIETKTLEQLCQFCEQYLACYEMAQYGNNCGKLTTIIANTSLELQENLCEQPWQPDVLSLLECVNNHKVQIFVYGEIREILGESSAYDRMRANSTVYLGSICRSIRRHMNNVLYIVGQECEIAARDKLRKFSKKLLTSFLSMILGFGPECVP